MNPEQGWYHADGDPAGTVRLWNGSAWVGFPQRDPSVEIDNLAGVSKFKPVPGQSRLGPLGVVTQIVLGLFGIAQLFNVVLLVQLSNVIDLETIEQEDALEEQVGVLWTLGTLAGPLLQLIALVTFLPWIGMAYGNIGRWHKTAHAPGWAIACWFVPFMNMVRPSRIFMELLEHSPRKGKEAGTNPVLGMVWAVFWVAPIAVYILLIAQLRQDFLTLLADPLEIARNVLVMMGVIAFLNAGALFTAAFIVRAVSKSQDERLHPSQKQLELEERDRLHDATFATNASALGQNQ